MRTAGEETLIIYIYMSISEGGSSRGWRLTAVGGDGFSPMLSLLKESVQGSLHRNTRRVAQLMRLHGRRRLQAFLLPFLIHSSTCSHYNRPSLQHPRFSTRQITNCPSYGHEPQKEKTKTCVRTRSSVTSATQILPL